MILTSRSTLPEAVLAVCKLWAEERSKDPSTKVGACVYDPRTGGLFLGYNGFPAGVPDDEDTWKFRGDGLEAMIRAECKLTKYDVVVHAEVNAVRKALMGGVDMAKAVLYCTHVPCPECMKNVVLANGVKQVVYSEDSYRSRVPRDGFVINELARMGGVKVQRLKNYFDTRNEALEKLAPEVEVRTWVCKSPNCTGDNCPHHSKERTPLEVLCDAYREAVAARDNAARGAPGYVSEKLLDVLNDAVGVKELKLLNYILGVK